jgi:glycosyltransferase involved in cell wall biosynthesis
MLMKTPLGVPNGRMSLSVLIPVFNEPQSPAHLIEQLRSVLGAEAEIVVIDDGSDIPVSEFDLPAGTKLIRQALNRGYGAAIKAGLAASTGERVVIIDSDGTYPVDAVPLLLAKLDDVEMAVGSRTGDAVHIPFLRRSVKNLLRGLASLLAEQPIPDINSGLRAFRRASAEPYLHLLPNRFSLTTTLTLAFLSDGRPVHFEPIDYHPRVGKSHWRPIVDTREFIITILRTIFLFNPMRICFPLAVGAWAGALIVLLIGLMGRQIADGTITVFALGGLQILLIGLLAEVVNRKR